MVDTPTDQEKAEAKKELAAIFASLPKPVQEAIASADTESEMRAVAQRHKLHFDQWEVLENNVLLTLLGIEKTDNFEKNIADRLDLDPEVAKALAADIGNIIFDPIRAKLQTALGHPDAQAPQTSTIDAIRAQALATSAPPIAPATPPSDPSTQKVVRAPISTSYHAGEPSSARTSIENDPYREPPT